MTDNEKLAMWQGPMFGELPHEYYEQPDYLNDDAVAMSLLDTLVEKGYIWSLYGKQAGCLCKIYKMPDAVAVDMQGGNDHREAVVAAVLKLIEYETLSGKEVSDV